MTGAGNDFVVIDNRRKALSNPKKTAVALCDRKFGVGADGLLLAEPSKKAQLKMRILNADGSEAEMCGNGVRCFAKFAQDAGILKGRRQTIETLAGLIEAEITGDVVKVRLSDPSRLKLDFRISFDGKSQRMHFVDTGVPHAVQIVEALDKVDVERLGRVVRRHERFAPKGANANFVKTLGPGRIQVRTYERGVEGETLACGTGSAASALVTAALKDWKSPVEVNTRGGETLKIHFSRDGHRFYDVYLEGRVIRTFEGKAFL